MSGGSLSVSGNEYFGNNGTGAFIHSGGTNNLGSLGGLYLGRNAGSSGIYNLSGSGVLSAYTEYVGYLGTGTFNQSGGSNTVTSALSLGTAGTYNLTGGALIVPGIQGAGGFNVGSGTLVAGADSPPARP